MIKYLITGFSGFVAKHFLDHLEDVKTPAYILGIDLYAPSFDIHSFKYIHCSFEQTNLLNKDELDNAIYQFQPTHIVHLASFSSVAYSWKNPIASFANNTNIFLNLLEKVRQMQLSCRILSIGSSEEYGNVSPEDLPLREDRVLNPLSPYAVARVSQEMLSKIYVDGYGLDIVMTRSFNHIGPGHKDIFVISSFAKQLVEIKKYKHLPEINTGDLSIIRDFLDVRDVVKAYHILLQKGRKGEVYNVCSGKGLTLEQVIQKMMQILDIKVKTVTNPSLIRPSDNPMIVGCNEKLSSETNWKPTYALEQSLEDMITYWSEKQ
jgi:GDP-4-dehydro-6-deoxy-D-mannose reductase